MSDLKFECPGCGQHMECDRACGGDVIHCPKCCAELRIPFPAPKTLPGSIQRAELLHPAAAPPDAPASSVKPGPSQQPAPEAVAAAPARVQFTEATCPVCQSHLRIKAGVDSKSAGPPITAELV